MKYFLHIAFLCTMSSAYGQQWRDSLDAARTAYENENYLEALKYYESAQKNAPDNINFSDEMAQSAYKAREFDKAEEIYKQGGNSKKTTQAKADNYHNIGNARMKRKDYNGAIDAYKESLRLNPNDDQTRYNLSEAIRQLKNKQKQENKNNQDQKNNDQQNKDNQKEGDQENDQNSQNQKNENDGKGQEENKSQLPNKTVDRMLDKLMKQEAETKRKANGTKGNSGSPNSGKDW